MGMQKQVMLLHKPISYSAADTVLAHSEKNIHHIWQDWYSFYWKQWAPFWSDSCFAKAVQMLNVMHVSIKQCFLCAHVNTCMWGTGNSSCLRRQNRSIWAWDNIRRSWTIGWICEQKGFSLPCYEVWPDSLGQTCHTHRGKNNPSLFA